MAVPPVASPAPRQAHAAVRRVVQRGRVRAEPEQRLHLAGGETVIK